MDIWTRVRAAFAPGAQQEAPQGEAARPTQPDADPMQGYSDIFASELIDAETCPSCAAIDGREYTSMAEARADYPEGGGHVGCTSESGCRGTLIFMRDA